jgi:zinc transport system ATP-binding protein
VSNNGDVVFATQHLGVHFGANQVLHDVNLVIRRGEVVAILGANGSGKSTLIRTLVGIQPASTGTVLAPDHGEIGFVPQRSSAGGGIPATALEVVSTGLLGRRRLRPPSGWRGLARAALAKVGLADRANEAVIHLSGGQQQRVFIARALIRNPQVLVLDEPLVGVDAASQEQLVGLLEELVKQGLTIVVVLHETELFAPLLTRVIVLRAGRIVADGSPTLTIGAKHIHDDATAHFHEPTISQLNSSQLAEHEIGFPELNSQIAGLTDHH